MPLCNMEHKKIVLIVEDDPLLRMVATDVVTEVGLEGISASGADEAKLILEQRNDIDILFTDIDMPGSMNGIGLAQWAKNSLKSIKIVITSGHSKIPNLSDRKEWKFFAKPYDIDFVARELKRMATI